MGAPISGVYHRPAAFVSFLRLTFRFGQKTAPRPLYPFVSSLGKGDARMSSLAGHTVYDHLRGAAVPLRASAHLGAGLSAALWERDEVATAQYLNPNHHTLSLYVDGGEGFSRLIGQQRLNSQGTGSLCLMPRGATSHWEVSGRLRMFHLYISHQAFDRMAATVAGGDPARIDLIDRSYFRDPVVEGMIRSAMLTLDWDAPADRLAVGHVGQALTAYLIAHHSNRPQIRAPAVGGLAPAVLRRVRDHVEDHLDRGADHPTTALGLDDLAGVAGLSAFHFARAFKRSTGESPHAYVSRRRVERAMVAIRQGMSLADVALSGGYSSQSHFTARFHQATGLTPRQYAAQMGVTSDARGDAKTTL